MDFGQSLRVFRTAAGLGLRQLARKVGVSPAYLSLVETGKAPPPSPVRALQIARALDMPPEALVNLTGRVDPEVLDILTALPETGDLVRAAARVGLGAAEISAIAAAMESGGKLFAQAALSADIRINPQKTRKTIIDSLDPGMVFPRLSCRIREDLFDFLARAAARIDPSLDHGVVLSTLLERESGHSSSFGSGVAIPHARMAELAKPVLAFGRSSVGIDYPGRDSGPVRLVFLLLSPPEGNLHLETLAGIARVFGRPAARERLLKARGKAGLLKALRAELAGWAGA